MTQRNSRECECLCGVAFRQARLIGFPDRRVGLEFSNCAINRIVTAVNNEAYVTLVARWPRRLRAPPETHSST